MKYTAIKAWVIRHCQILAWILIAAVGGFILQQQINQINKNTQNIERNAEQTKRIQQETDWALYDSFQLGCDRGNAIRVALFHNLHTHLTKHSSNEFGDATIKTLERLADVDYYNPKNGSVNCQVAIKKPPFPRPVPYAP